MGDRTSSRILFNFGGTEETGIATIPFEGRDVPLLTRVPASSLTEATTPPDPGLVRGRVVVIGTSYVDARDTHLTPLGEMPGALIVANAAYSLGRHGGLKPPAQSVIITLQLLLIAVASLAFAALGSWWTTMLSTPLVIFLLLPLAFWFFRHGVWLDFALPLVALQMVSTVKRYRERTDKVMGDIRDFRERRSFR